MTSCSSFFFAVLLQYLLAALCSLTHEVLPLSRPRMYDYSRYTPNELHGISR